jgi:Chaperone of endosialidase
MNPLTQSKNTTFLPLLIALVFVCFGLSPATRAVVPPPDGGYPGFNTAEGQKALFSLTTGVGNTAVGWYSLWSNTDGSFNTGVGAGTLLFNVGDQGTGEGVENTAVGAAALLSNTTGRDNTAVGTQALFNNTTGIGNIALGASAGFFLNTGSNNIVIGNAGSGAESDTIRIGSTHTRAFIAGIRGATTANAAVPVLIDTAGQLGTMSSSARFKNDIKPMDKVSDALLGLKPVTFHYKSDARETPQFGLIAEEVAKVNSDLVVRDKDGKPYSVRYDQVNAMLLNEFLKEHRKVQQLEATIARQQKAFQATATHQQKQIEALAAGLQKVSTRLEVSKPESRLASH